MPDPAQHRLAEDFPPTRDTWRAGPGTLWRLGATYALTWSALFGLALGIGAVLPGTVWVYALLPRSARTGLIALSGTAHVLLALLVGTLLIAPQLIATSRWGARPAVKRAVALLCLVLTGCTLLLYGASWGAYYGTGQFLNSAAIDLWAASPVQMLKHVVQLQPELLLIIPTAATLASLLLARQIVRLTTYLSAATCRRVTLLMTMIVVMCAFTSSSAHSAAVSRDVRLRDPESGVERSYADFYMLARATRTGPIVHLIAQYEERRARSGSIPLTALTVPVDTSAIIPMERYLSTAERARVHPWNVVVLVVESLRSDRLSPYGGHRTVMPSVERLARGSRVFTDHVTNATHSNYASVVPMSGQYPLRALEQVTYPEHPEYPRVLIYDVLKGIGYHTAVFSSQNEYWGGMFNFLNSGSVDHFLHAETYHGETYVPSTDVGFFRWVEAGKRAGKIDDRFTVGEATRWLDSLYGTGQDHRPFVMYVNLQNSHVPYPRPADFPARFGSGRTSFAIGFNRFPPDSAAAVQDIYDNSLSYVDAQIGRLITQLEQRGLWEHTVFVLTGDHGQAFFEHGFAAHGNVPYVELSRAPLLIRAPGLTPTLDDRPAQHVDVAPTILSILGLPPHPGFQGIDLLGARPPADRPRFVVTQTALSNSYSIVRGGHTLILDGRSGAVMLYDDRADPTQRRDISDSLPAVADSLLRELEMWRRVQLEYYGSPYARMRWYPPNVRFWQPLTGTVVASDERTSAGLASEGTR
jgi:arylsulfatase